MVPPMVEKHYDRDFSAALIASAGSLGVLIPPSIPMVLYCIAGEVSQWPTYLTIALRRFPTM